MTKVQKEKANIKNNIKEATKQYWSKNINKFSEKQNR